MKLDKHIAPTCIIIALIMVLFVGCGEEENSPIKNEESISISELGGCSQEPKLTVLKSDKNQIIIRAEIFGLVNEKVNTVKGSFAQVTIPGQGYTSEIGKPRLPVIRRLVEIPYGASVNIKVRQKTSREVCLEKGDKIIPVQKSVPKTGEKPGFVIDEDYYKRSSFEPVAVASLGERGIIRGHRVVQLEICPLSYSPGLGKVKYCSMVEVELNLTGSDMIKTEENARKFRFTSLDRVNRKHILNYDGFQTTAYAAKAGEKSSAADGYLIIVSNTLYPAVEPLAEWKREKGFKVEVANTYDIGSGKTNIKNHIQDAYDNWTDPPLTYVVLFGDSDRISTYAGDVEEVIVTDLPYSKLDGSDYFPDVGLGRISVETTDEAQTVINKILKYEKTVDFPSTDWFLKASFIAMASTWWEVTEETHNFVISSYTEPAGYTGTFPNNPQPGGDKLYAHSTSYDADTPELVVAFNEGRSIIVYSGHGLQWEWCGPDFTKTNVEEITDTVTAYPLAIGLACYTGDFTYLDWKGGCVAESWLREENAAIAYIGSTVIAFVDGDNALEKGMFEAIYEDEIFTLSGLFNAGKLFVYNFFDWTWGRKERYYEQYHLFGDPSLELVTDIPVSMSVSHSPSLPLGPATFSVTVTDGTDPVEGALVCLYNDEVHDIGLTDANGQAAIDVSPGASTEGEVTLTVTKHNFIPYQSQVQVGGVPPELPDAPSDLTATAMSSSQIDLTWTDNSDNENGFRIYRSSSAAVKGTLVETTSAYATSYSDTGLSPSTTYYYRVYAYNLGGESLDYASDSATTDSGPAVPPDAPTDLVATAVSSSQIDLTWTDNSDNEDSFKIYRSSSAAVKGTLVETTSADESSYSDTGLSPETTYFYRVYSCNVEGESVEYAEDSATTDSVPVGLPDAPTDLTATAMSSSQIDLAWTDNSDNEDGFKIYRSLSAAIKGTLIETTSANEGSYSDTGLSPETTYYYRVYSYNAEGESVEYASDSATTEAVSIEPPDAPTDLTATAVSGSQIDLTWTDNSDDEDGFRIYCRVEGSPDYYLIATVGANVTSYSHTGLSANTTHYYRVFSYNSAGNSSAYASDSATTLDSGGGTVPEDPSDLVVTAVSSSQIDLMWQDNSTDETGFRIYRQKEGAVFFEIAGIVGADVTSYSDMGLEAETLYHYRVYAYNGGGLSDGYASGSATTLEDDNPSPPYIPVSDDKGGCSCNVDRSKSVNPAGMLLPLFTLLLVIGFYRIRRRESA